MQNQPLYRKWTDPKVEAHEELALSPICWNRGFEGGPTVAQSFSLCGFKQIPKARRSLLRPAGTLEAYAAPILTGNFNGNFNRPVTPLGESCLHQAEEGCAILRYQFQPRRHTHLRKIDSPETDSGDENAELIPQRPALESPNPQLGRLPRDCRLFPTRPLLLRAGLFDRHLQRSVSHCEWNEFHPMLGARQTPRFLEPLVKRRRGQRREQTEKWQAGRPGLNFLQRPFATPGVSLSIPNMNEVIA